MSEVPIDVASFSLARPLFSQFVSTFQRRREIESALALTPTQNHIRTVVTMSSSRSHSILVFTDEKRGEFLIWECLLA